MPDSIVRSTLVIFAISLTQGIPVGISAALSKACRRYQPPVRKNDRRRGPRNLDLLDGNIEHRHYENELSIHVTARAEDVSKTSF